MTSLIQKIAKEAVKTFRRDRPNYKANFKTNFEHLHSLMNQLTSEDLNLDLTHLQGSQVSEDSAPVNFMHLYEDEDFTIAVFILKNGAYMPLHDHPDMNGLLKVVYGNISIQSFTVSELDERTKGPSVHSIYPAIKYPSIKVSSTDPACHLSPEYQNLHEIKSIDGPAAFLDILSPPYGNDKRLGVERDCNYFQEIDPALMDVNDLAKNMSLLLNISHPPEYWCERVPYKGPKLDKNTLNG